MVAGAHRSAVRRRRVPIVGLAASDSSLTALTSVLGTVGAESDLCFVVVLALGSAETEGLSDRLQGHDRERRLEAEPFHRGQRTLRGVPKCAIAFGAVDSILPPEQMAAALHAHAAGIDRLPSDLVMRAPAFFRDAQIRVWVPGCATGEEACSIAIVLAEQMAQTSGGFQIFATDADPHQVAIARTGRYPASIAIDVAPARLARFFERDGPCYKIVPSLRRTLMFGVHDLRNDPPFSRIDVVSCRGVLTSLGPDARQQMLSLFHFALRPGAHLFLERGEHIGARGALFTTNSGLTTLRLWDDGRGIKDVEPGADGVGLRIMNYRARSIGATLSATSHARGGTMVTCVVREALHTTERTASHAS